MCNVRSVVSWIFFQFVRDVIGMVIAIQQYVLMFFEGGYFEGSLLQNYDYFSFVLYVFLD